MPTLHWIGKDKVVNHHQEVPYRVLEHKYGFRDGKQSIEDTGSGNMIIHGDNLLALKALLPKYQGRIKCIYIDPPYNTGNEKWVYNDNVNDPHIKKWLGEVVGTEGEDLSRHDKWLCMIYPRMVLLHKLLSDNGVIFISIDDNEYASLKILCDEIFGQKNFVCSFVWQKKTGAADARGIATITEYILCYCKNIQLVASVFKNNDAAFDVKRYRFKDEYFAERGAFYYDTLDRGSIRYSDTLNYPITAPNGDIIYPNGRKEFANDGWTWKWSKEKVEWGLNNGFITISESPKSKNGWVVKYKIYLNVDNEGNKINKSVPYKNLITDILNADAASLMKQLFSCKVFDYSKPVELISFLLSTIQLSEGSIILDSFAGSGTTGHAILNLNKDGVNRKFILVEMEEYAESVTSETIRRIINGYGEGNKSVKGTGGAFDYYELGEPLFGDDGNLNETVGEDKIREYIFFSETQQSLPERDPMNKYFLGNVFDTAYYFYYTTNALTTLNHETLRQIVKQRAEQYIIYADTCTLTEEEMRLLGVIYKKIPRDIKRF